MNDIARTPSSLLSLVEKDLDANYHRLPLPHQNKFIATWYLFTSLEDSQRWLFALSEDGQTAIVEFHVDRQKYSARFALDRIQAECSDSSRVTLPSRSTPKLCVQTSDLLQGGIDFALATQLCSLAHTGTLQLQECDGSIEVVNIDKKHNKRYAALELLGHSYPTGIIDHPTLLYVWIRREEMRPVVLNVIASSVKIVGSKVSYQYHPELASDLATQMMQPPFLVPDGWEFSWGGREQTTLLINALCVRCMYHMVAVHFGASAHGLRGGGVDSILLVLSKEQLVHDIREMSSLSEATIRSFVGYLTYGYKMTTPDPALQPLISLGERIVGIPCIFFLSSNHERNILALQARIESPRFNKMSKLFERDMVRDLLEVVRPRWPLSKGNVTIRVAGESEEIDLLIADLSSRTLLVCELRWMLQPGDTREVQNRKKACWEKVDQLHRKVEWLRSRVDKLLNSEFDISCTDVQDWRVEGVVVITKFGGVLSTRNELPIMTTQLFTLGIQRVNSLVHFVSWCKSLDWLPQEGVHFQALPQEFELRELGKKLIFQGIKKLAGPQSYTKFVEQTLKRHSV